MCCQNQFYMSNIIFPTFEITFYSYFLFLSRQTFFSKIMPNFCRPSYVNSQNTANILKHLKTNWFCTPELETPQPTWPYVVVTVHQFHLIGCFDLILPTFIMHLHQLFLPFLFTFYLLLLLFLSDTWISLTYKISFYLDLVFLRNLWLSC